MMKNSAVAVFSGSANPALGRETAKAAKKKLGKLKIEKFPDGETYCRFDENLKGKKAFIVQSVCPPVSENLVELLIILDAAKRQRPKKLTAVIPYYGYARQDRATKKGEPVSAQLAARAIKLAGADAIIAMDLHSKAVEKFVKPKKHVRALPAIAQYFRKKKIKKLVVVAPDYGALKNARKQARVLKAKVAVIKKKRLTGKKVAMHGIEGNVKGKNCVIIDDIISTGGTMAQAIRALKKFGAENVYIAATHGLFVGPCIKRLNSAKPREIIVTNSIPQKENKKHLRGLKTVSVAKLLAKEIK